MVHVLHNNRDKFPRLFLFCSAHQHGGDDVRWKPPIQHYWNSWQVFKVHQALAATQGQQVLRVVVVVQVQGAPRGSNGKSSSVNVSVIENVVKRIISDFQRQGKVSMFGECIEVRTHLFECGRSIFPSNGRKMKFLIHSSSKVYDQASIARLFEGGRKFITWSCCIRRFHFQRSRGLCMGERS